MKKVCKIMFIVITILSMFCIISFANNIDASKFKPSGNVNDPELVGIGHSIIGVAQLIGSMIAVGLLAILGIQIMLASPDQKADIKKRLIPYLIGAVLLFSIVNILSILYNIFN